MQNTVDAKMPECNRALSIHDKSQAIGEFIDWLEEEKKIHLCEEAGVGLAFTFERTEDLLAEFFGINLAKMEREKRDMLKELRTSHAREAGDLKLETPAL